MKPGVEELPDFAHWAETYIKMGLALVPIPIGKKGPTTPGWNRRENAWRNGSPWPAGMQIGNLHAYAEVGPDKCHTACIDIDVLKRALEVCRGHGVDLQKLIDAPDAFITTSGREGRLKLWYTLPKDMTLPSRAIYEHGHAILELRCGDGKGNSKQDILPPSIHPDTGQPYQVVRARGSLPPIPGEVLEKLWRPLISRSVSPSERRNVEPDPTDLQEIISALDYIPADLDRDSWIRIGMALHHFDPDLYALFDSWSATAREKYAGEHDTAAVWNSFKSMPRGEGISIASLFAAARAHHWRSAAHSAAALFAPIAGAGGEEKTEINHLNSGEWEYPVVLYQDIAPKLDVSALIEGVLLPGSFSLTYGEPNAGKTFDALHRGLCIGSGREYFSKRVQKGMAVYLAAEGGRFVENRVFAFKRELFPESDFVLVPHSMDLLRPDGDVQGIIRLLKGLEDKFGIPASYVVQDTLNRALAGGNENSSEDVGALIRHADVIRRETGCCFEFVHHPGKDVSRGARGHSSLRGNTDTELELTVDGEIRSVRATKQRDLELGEPWHFRLDSVLIGMNGEAGRVTSCVPRAISGGDTRSYEGLNETTKLLLECINEGLILKGENRRFGNQYTGGGHLFRGVSVKVARGVFYGALRNKRNTAEQSGRPMFNRALKMLQALEIIKVWNDYIYYV